MSLLINRVLEQIKADLSMGDDLRMTINVKIVVVGLYEKKWSLVMM